MERKGKKKTKEKKRKERKGKEKKRKDLKTSYLWLDTTDKAVMFVHVPCK